MQSGKVLCVALLVLCPLGERTSASDGGDLAAPLRSAAGELASAASRSGDPMRALTQVVGILAQVAERAGLAPDVRTKIAAARDGLRRGAWSAEPAAVGQLNDAYAVLNGRRFSFGAGVTNADAARTAYEQEIERAASALGKDRLDEGARAILEALMLVTTRMTAD